MPGEIKEFAAPRAVRGYDFSNEEVLSSLGLSRMLLMSLFTGPGCNLQCPYCFTRDWARDDELLSIEEQVALLEDTKALGSRSVWWVGQGEPFLVPFWRELVEACEHYGLWLGIFTNGTMLDRETLAVLAERPVSLYVKLNSFDPCIQDRLIGAAGSQFLDVVMPAIEWCVQHGMAGDRRLAVESVVTNLNYGEIPALFRWCRDRGVIPFIEMMEHACEGAVELDVSPEQHAALFSELLRIDREEYGYEWDIVPPWAAYRCRNIYLGLAVDAWGNVTPCSGMRYSLGNIREASLEDIWNSEEARRLRNPALQEPQPWDGQSLGCYGCKSHAYKVTGDPFGVDPRCNWFKTKSSGKTESNLEARE